MIIGCVPKKTTLFLVLLVLLVLLPTEPVITAQKQDDPQVERTAFINRCVLTAGSPYAGEQVITETFILYVKDAISAGYIEGNSPISGAVWVRLSGSIDLTTMLGSFDGKLTITTTEGGTFEGSIVGVVAVASVSGRFVGQGTNNLQRQKIKGSFDGTVNNFIVDLTLQGELTSKTMTPKNKKVIPPVRGNAS